MKAPRAILVLTMFALTACSSDTTSPADPGATSVETWRETAIIQAPTPARGEQSGDAVALSTDGATLAVGAPMNPSGGTGTRANDASATDTTSYSSGAVRVYSASDEGWTLDSFIKPSNTGLNDQFGSTLALSGDGNTLAVSAVFEDGGSTGINGNGADDSVPQSGAVYLFTREGETWSETVYVKASNTGEPDDGDTFGYSISLSRDGDTLAVGAPSEDSRASGIDGDQTDNSAMASGAVYVFTRNGADWSQQAYLKSWNNTAGVLFGYAVALDADGSRLVASAYDEDAGRGAVYLFTRDDGVWSREVRLQASNIEAQDSMGVWVDISDDGETIAVGSPDEDSYLRGVANADEAGDDQATNTSAGAVYVFALSEGTWWQQALLKASNTGLEDWFGYRLAIAGDGNTLTVSAPNEDSSLSESSDDDSASEAGAVYLYRRNALEWTFERYLKGSGTTQFDEFGSGVDLSGDGGTLAVGTRFEDGVGEAEGSDDAGAVYVFRR